MVKIQTDNGIEEYDSFEIKIIKNIPINFKGEYKHLSGFKKGMSIHIVKHNDQTEEEFMDKVITFLNEYKKYVICPVIDRNEKLNNLLDEKEK